MVNNKFHLFLLLLIYFSCASCSGPKQLFDPLFNGTDLTNFEKLNGTATFAIKNNTIVGITKEGTPNTFLATKEKYSDFILEFEVLADPTVNSGVQFRSISDPAIMDGRVHGYQVEIESSPRKWAGGIYDEARRGWLYPLKENPIGQQAFKIGQWNHYRIEAIGHELRTWVNGIQCANLIDNKTVEGFIAFQVHSIESKDQANKTIEWRNINIQTKDLAKARKPVSASAKEINLTVNNMEKIKFVDQNNNVYSIQKEMIDYRPMKPLESSSGVYSGGAPAKVKITPAIYDELTGKIIGIINNPRLQTEKRQMGTAMIYATRDGKTEKYTLPKSHERTVLEQKLKDLILSK